LFSGPHRSAAAAAAQADVTLFSITHAPQPSSAWTAQLNKQTSFAQCLAAGFTAADGRRNWRRFMRCVNTLPDRVPPEEYLCPWFCNAPYEQIKRDNIAEMLVYGFYYAKM
jgi:hypothetical protein